MFDSTQIQISPEILSLIAGIDEFKGAWRAFGTLAPERLSALRRVATIESIAAHVAGGILACTVATAHTNPVATKMVPRFIRFTL